MKTGTRRETTGNSKKVKVFGFAGAGGQGDLMKRAKTMARFKALGALLFFIEIFLSTSSFAWAAEFISKVPNADGNYCHLKFPAISESTLFSERPVLKDPSEGDIRDFYGPCDYDPLGNEEIRRQRADHQRERRRRYGSD